MSYTAQHVENLSKALVAQEVVKAFFMFQGFYQNWDALPSDIQQNVKSLEPVYLTLIKSRADYQI